MRSVDPEECAFRDFLVKSAFFLVAEARVSPWWDERISMLIRSGFTEEAGALYREFQPKSTAK